MKKLFRQKNSATITRKRYVKKTEEQPEAVVQAPSKTRRFFRFIWSHKFLIGCLLLLAIGYFVYRNLTQTKTQTSYVVAKAKKGDITLTVEGTGQVTALNQVNLMPLASGVIRQIKVKDGDDVKAGQVIAVLDQRSAAVAVSQAKASLESAQASYQKLLAGATSADIQSSQVAVDSAQASLDNAQKNLDDVTKQQQLSVDNSYHAFLNSGLMNSGISSAGFGGNPNPANRSTIPPSISGTYMGTTTGEYLVTIFTPGQPYFMVSGLETGEGAINGTGAMPLGTKGLYIQFTSGQVFDGDSWTITIPNTRASNYLGNLSNYQSALQNQKQALHNAQASVDNAQASLDQAKANLALKQEAARPEDVAVSKAQVDIAQSQLENVQLAYQNLTVAAPFAGQIAQVNSLVGDQASQSTAIATLITKQTYVSVPLNEVDAAKVKVEQKVNLTFDAIENLTLTGKVFEIQTLGTVTQGVVNYNIKISFDTPDPRIKPGMSSQASIVTDERTGVLTIPNTAIKTQGTRAYVETLDAATITSTKGASSVTSSASPSRKMIQIGLANDTDTEVTGGLSAGDLVVVQTIGSTATSQTTTSGQGSAIRIPGLGGFGGR